MQDSVEVPYNIAAVDQAQGHYDEAIQVLQTLLKKTEKPDGNYTSRMRRTTAPFSLSGSEPCSAMAGIPLALETFRKMVSLGDDNAVRGYQQIIDTYREGKQWQQATNIAKEAVPETSQRPRTENGASLLSSRTWASRQGTQRSPRHAKGGPEDREVYITLAQMNTRLRRWARRRRSTDESRVAFHQARRERDTFISFAVRASSARSVR